MQGVTSPNWAEYKNLPEIIPFSLKIFSLVLSPLRFCIGLIFFLIAQNVYRVYEEIKGERKLATASFADDSKSIISDAGSIASP